MDSLSRMMQNVGETLGISKRSLDPEPGLIFITGVDREVIGYRTATRLLRSGYAHVRVGGGFTKNNDKQDHLEHMKLLGAEIIADFSWGKPESFEEALTGVKSVFCTVPYCKDWEKNFDQFLDACKIAGVQHVVKLSFYHARVSGDVFQDVPLVRTHGTLDEVLVNSGISYTILSASHFMSNPFLFQRKELRRADMKPAVYYGSSHDKRVNYVSPNDVAEVAVKVVLDPRSHAGKEYTLTGPESISDQEVSQLLSRHLDKPIMYVDQPFHTFQDTQKMAGEPEWVIQDLMVVEKIKASGKEEEESFKSNDIERVCGHSAENFEAYLNMKESMTPVEAG